jgi:hypothetical protein
MWLRHEIANGIELGSIIAPQLQVHDGDAEGQHPMTGMGKTVGVGWPRFWALAL